MAITPSPPATTNVESAPEDRKIRATISTLDEERTGPGVSASTLIDTGAPAKRAAISNTEIGPAASRIWKSGNMRMPIVMARMS